MTPLHDLAARISRDVVAATRDALAADPSAAGASALAAKAAAFADGAVAHAAQVGPAPACRDGCDACCHLHVVILAPEAIALADHVRRTFSPAALAALSARIDAHNAVTQGLTADARRRVRIPCPLLDHNRCTAYAARPLACRGWNSLDRTLCDLDLADPATDRPARLNHTQYLLCGKVGAGLASGTLAAGLDPRPLDLPRALRILLDHPPAADSWALGRDGLTPATLDQAFPALEPEG